MPKTSRRVTRHLSSFCSCFDVLKLGVSGESEQWLGLPPPPFVNNPRYDDKYAPAIIRSHTVVDGGRTICARRHVGDWSLPFDGCAEYAPHLNLWLGFSRETPQDLCWTSELSGMPMEQPPELQHVWRDSVTPENWSPMMSTLVNLVSGRFCITKLFEIKRSTCDAGYYGYYYPDVEIEVAVLTGIEICSREARAQGAQAQVHNLPVHA